MKTFKNDLQVDAGTNENNQAKHKAVFIPAKNEPPTADKTSFDTGRVRIVKSVNRQNQFLNIPPEQGHPGFQTITSIQFDDAASDTVRKERTQMCFFYIGHDEAMFEHFTDNFEYGYHEANLQEGITFLRQLYLQNMRLPDVVFIDLPLDEAGLHKFCSKIKYNLLLSNLPIIYNENQLTHNQINQLKQLRLIDDITTFNSNEIDYFSKVMFLKQSKLYSQIFVATKNQLRQKKSFLVTLSFIMKRLTDISIALVCILIFLPLLLLIAIVIKLESKGPIFYTALRAGKGFRVFSFYKFRSMVPGADKEVESLSGFNQYSTSNNGPKFFKINNDPRVTRFGKFLRNTSADELPQLFNVLKGDMSLVGNRPLPIYEAVTLTTNEFVERFTAHAGITGLWQINKRGKADMSTEERINLDITYSRKSNFLYDLNILVKTPLVLFQKSDV